MESMQIDVGIYLSHCIAVTCKFRPAIYISVLYSAYSRYLCYFRLGCVSGQMLMQN